MDSGYYLLLVYVRSGRDIAIGRRAGGSEFFPRGWYVYIGSAARGLSKRIERHFRKEKKLHWHIDYLLSDSPPRKAFTISDPDLSLRNRGSAGNTASYGSFECRLAEEVAAIPGARRIHKGFGSGDCSCPGHLVFCGGNPSEIIPRLEILAGTKVMERP